MTDALATINPPTAPDVPPPAAPPPEEPGFVPDDAPRLDVQPSTAAWHRDTHSTSAPLRALVVTQLLLCLCGGLFIGLVTLPHRPREPLFVSVPVGEYEDPAWPLNPWANRDTDLLADRFGGSAVKAFGFQSRERLGALLGWLAGDAGAAGLPQVHKNRPVVVHISALGAVRGREVFILPADARPDDPAGWVNVADVLKAAAARRTPNTMLFLDVARPAADPFGGNLGDDVSVALHDVLTAFRPEYPVFAACGPGEASLPADAAGSSVFAFYLAEGLGGAADGFEDRVRGPDGELTVREIVRFTTARVDRWARQTAGRRQVPTLYGPDRGTADFVLVRNRPWSPPDPTPPSAYPPWLRPAGGERDSLRLTESARQHPVAFARLTAGLLTAEQRWLRPGTATRAEDAWRLARDEWARATSWTPSVFDWTKLPAAADRVTVARVGVPDAPPEVAKALTAFLVAKPEQEAEAATAWAAAGRPHRVAAVGLVWALAADTTTPTADMVGRWARAAEAVDPVKPLTETRVLRAVAARESFRRQKLAVYPVAAVAALFRAEDELGRLLALGPGQFLTVADSAAVATRDLRFGTDRLLSAGTAGHADEATVALARAADEFARARERLGRARVARNVLETAVLVLGETVTGMTEFDRPPAGAWFAVAAAATRVSAAGPESATPTDVSGLLEATERLVSVYGPVPVLRASGPDRRTDPRGPAELRSLLAGAGLGGSGRQRVWDALLADTARLHTFAREHESDAPPGVSLVEGAGARRLRRAEASVALLRLAGSAAADEADGLLRKALAAGRAKESEQAWGELGARLRTAWFKDLPDVVRAGGPAAERVVRAVPPGAARYRAWADLPAPRPADSLAAFRSWVESTSGPTVVKESR